MWYYDAYFYGSGKAKIYSYWLLHPNEQQESLKSGQQSAKAILQE